MASSVIGALRVNLGLDSAQFSRGAKKAQTASQRLGRELQKIGAAASAVGAGIALAVRGQLNAADQLGKTAQQIGLPVEQLSQLQHAAALSGVSMSSLEISVRRLSQNMVDGAEKFEALGISVRNADGEMRRADEVMADLAAVLAEMPDGAEKTALAIDLMGRSGAEMIPLLNGGRDALREMMEEADRLGLTISEDTAQAAAEFNDNLQRLGGLVQGFIRIMSAEFAPVLAKVSDVVVALSERFQGLSPEVRRFIGIAGAIAVAIGPVVLAIGTMVTLIGAPAIGLIALVSLLVAGLVALWPAIRDTATALIEMVEQGVEYAKVKIEELITFVTDLPARMAQAGSDLMTGLRDGIVEGFTSARDAMGNAASGLIERARGIFQTQSPSRVFAEIGRDLMDGLAVGIRDNIAAPMQEMSNLGQSIGGSLTTAFDGIIRGTMSAKDAIKGLIADLVKLAAQAGFRALFGSIFGGPSFGGFRAAGGPVTAGRAYVVGENGPEIMVPRGSGTIIPNGAGGGVTVNNVYHFAPGVSPDQLRVEGERIKRETIASITAARRENRAFLA